jgi:hypothetical protein
MIALTNLFNRLNATTRQVAGAWGQLSVAGWSHGAWPRTSGAT